MLVEEFGQASNTMVIAMGDPDFFKHLEEWLGLVEESQISRRLQMPKFNWLHCGSRYLKKN